MVIVLVMAMGICSTLSYAQVINSEITAVVADQEYKKIDVKDLPGDVSSSIEKNYPDSVMKEAYICEKEDGNLYKVIVTVTEEEVEKDITVILKADGEIIES